MDLDYIVYLNLGKSANLISQRMVNSNTWDTYQEKRSIFQFAFLKNL